MLGLDGPRGTTPPELAAVVALCDAIFAPETRHMGPVFPTLFAPSNGEWLRTFWDGDRVVSHVGVWLGRVQAGERTLGVAHIGAVCTLPEYRNRGLAGALLADLLPRLVAAEADLLLISGHRRLYQSLGARPFGVLLRYRVPRQALEDLPLPRLGTRVPRGVDELAGLQAVEPYRYLRSAEDWSLLAPAKGYLPPVREPGPLQGMGSLVAVDGEEPVAYLLLGRPRREGDVGVLPVDEFGGERLGVLAALVQAMELRGAALAELRVRPGDVDLRRYLEAAGLRAEIQHQQGTGRILRACAFPPLHPWDPDPSLPAAPLGSGEEADAAAALTERLLGPGGLELPRNDGLNYI